MINRPVALRTPLQGVVTPRSFRQRLGEGMSAFQTAFFGPLTPITPVTSLANEPPRQFQYQAGSNVSYIPRSSEGLTPFSWMINVAEMYDTASMCIQARCDEMVSYEWDIVAIDKDDLPSGGEVSEARAFLMKPDGEHRWDVWVGMLMEELLVTDALTIYRQRTRKGEILALDLVDGSTTKPLVDARGRRPLDPKAPAFQQVMYGQVIGEYTAEQMLYEPKNQRTRSMYGKSPTEHLIMTINRALRRQSFDLHYYTDGNIPEALISLPDLDPDQIEVIQAWFDNILTAPENRRRVHFIPGQSRLTPYEFKKPIIDPLIEQFLDQRVLAMYGVMPSALGFTYDANRASAGISENVELRRRIPYLRFVSGVLTEVLHEQGWKKCKLQFLAEKPDEDRYRQAQIDEIYSRIGKESVDEMRIRDNQKPWGVGAYVLTGVGPVPLVPALEAGEKNLKAQGEPQAEEGEPPQRSGNHTQQERPTHKETDRPMQDEEKAISTTRALASTEVRHWQRWAEKKRTNPETAPFAFRHLTAEEGGLLERCRSEGYSRAQLQEVALKLRQDLEYLSG